MTKIVTLLLFATLLTGCSKCVQSHKELRHQDAWTQLIPSGKGFVFIYHPARNYEAQICDEYED